MKIDLPSTGFVREKNILRIVPVSHSTLWNYVKSGKFPRPVKLSGNVTAWRNEDVIAWITEKSRGAV